MILKTCLRSWHNEDYIITCKKMITDTDSIAPVGLPEFIDRTAEILSWMKSRSKEELKAIWKCNDKIAEQNFNQLENMDLYNMLTPAVLSYEGIAFQYMAPSVFENQQFDYIQNHLRILSAFYGVLKPMDGVTPYRLEMKAKAEIEDTKNLYDYWGERLYRSVFDDSRIIINLASKEYSKCIEKYLSDKDKYITVTFCEQSGDDLLFLQNKKCTNCREMNTMRGLSRKLYLDLSVPTEEDQRSDQQRILEALSAEGVKEEVHIPVRMLRQLYPLLDRAGWKITVSLSWNGEKWELVDIESGDTARQHYGLAVDLGSTTVVVRLLDCNSGEILGEESCFNKQIQWGTDILSRIFFCKDDRKKLEEIRLATVESIIECMDKLDVKHPVSRKCLSMVVAGNTTMIHFLLGIDAFCVFYTPHAVHADRPGFQPAKDLDIPLNGYVYCYPAKSNYLGGDIISGMIETELYKKDGISVFFDIGTNGELVIGNKDFLLCGAGAAGPALEGGVVHTGMRADAGAVDSVRIRGGKIHVHVIGNSSGKISPKGICGSGIVDLIAELFLEGWIDIRGKFSPEKTNLIQKREGQLCIEYAPGLYFYQKDIDEFILTKAAAHIMVEIMLRESGLELNQADRFYVAGSFGKYVSVESAITIGMYPDMEREKMINAGNSSLEGAQKLLLNKELLADIDQILEEMTYIQFAEVDDFLEQMVAAQALPHTDYKKYPTVMEKLKKRQNICFY